MNYDKYADISISPDRLDYLFLSNGTKGNLNKLIHFHPFSNNDQIYNLSLGTIKENGNVDFITLSKNGDRNKILGTIGSAAHAFSENYPEKKIFLKGDTAVKTRLYQMAINHAYNDISETFVISGLQMVNKKYIVYPFLQGTNYDAFLFERKSKKNWVKKLEVEN
ncbi:hypothetical protein [Pedobacter sp. L105]|uniref:DUF6934 family protein n=1 Tax=Pedobacter sp. L105 TaxID=1641871 RepID=UPI00131C5831|nr:hypothetical protein [Pedobacter sp. L105]